MWPAALNVNRACQRPPAGTIQTFNQARRGGVALHRTGRGHSLTSERTGAPLARLRPTGDADTVQVLW